MPEPTTESVVDALREENERLTRERGEKDEVAGILCRILYDEPRPDADKTCHGCGGRGRLRLLGRLDGDPIPVRPICSACEGTGRRPDTKETPTGRGSPTPTSPRPAR